MLFLYFKAPFGAFRSFQSIEMSMTADFVTHSAAYGLLLGLAGVPRESKKDYAGARIALGLKGERLPLHGRAYQQLHWVKLEGRVEKRKGKPPKGETLKAAFERSKGTKPDIRPYIREFLHGCESYDEVDHDPTGKVSGARYRLHGFEGYIGLNDSALEELVRRGVEEPTTLDYWGLPFMGDNNFFVERLEVSDDPSPCRWFSLYQGEPLSHGARLHYLSVWTDYEADNESEPRSVSRSGSLPFALTDTKDSPPDKAWIPVQEFNTKQ